METLQISPTGGKFWWARPGYAFLLVAMMAVPLLWPRVPPLVDLLGHMGRYRVELDLGQSASLRRFYDFHWILAGNLGVDLLVLPLGRLIDLEPAVKLVAILIPVIGAVGLLWTASEAHGALPPTAAAALAFLYGLPFAFGFLNYTLAMSLAFCAFALWLRRSSQADTLWNGLLFGGIALLLWLCHVFGWAVFVILVIGSEWPERDEWRSWPRRAGRIVPLALPLLPMVVWGHGAPPSPPAVWFNLSQKFYWIESCLRDRWALPELAMVGSAILLLVFALASGRIGFERRLAIPAAMLLGCFVLLPEQLLGSSYTDARLVPYLFAIALIAIRPVEASGMAVVSLALLGAKLGAFTLSAALASHDIDQAAQALQQMPMGARVASVVVQPCGGWPLPKLSHVGALVVVRREGFSNEQWIGGGTNPLQTTPAYSGPMTRSWSEAVRLPSCPLHQPLLANKLAAIPRATFDFVWVVDGGQPMVPGGDLVGVFGRTALYRLR